MIYSNAGIDLTKIENYILRSKVGPTTSNYGRDKPWTITWTDFVCGDISQATKIRIGINSRHSFTPICILFAEEQSQDTKGITFRFNEHKIPRYGGIGEGLLAIEDIRKKVNYPGYKS